MASQFKTESLILMRKIGLRRPVAWKTLGMQLFLLAAFGILLPWLKGVEFMDPALPTIYACLGPLFAAPAVVQMLRADSGFHHPTWATTSARIAAATAYGEAMTLAILLLGIGTVLIFHRQAYLFLPDPILLGEAILLGFGSTLALTAMSAWITLQFSARIATSALRILFLFLFALFVLRSWWLPGVAGLGALIALVVAACFLLLVKWRTAS
jgi:hypothetical protein